MFALLIALDAIGSSVIPGHLPKKMEGSEISRHHTDGEKNWMKILSSSILKKDQCRFVPEMMKNVRQVENTHRLEFSEDSHSG